MRVDKDIISNLPGPASSANRLPLLVDIFMNLSQIFVLVVAIITAVLSVLANVEPLIVILRTAVAILAVGIPIYVLNFLLGRYFVKATLEEMIEKLPEKDIDKPAGTTSEEPVGELEKEA